MSKRSGDTDRPSDRAARLELETRRIMQDASADADERLRRLNEYLKGYLADLDEDDDEAITAVHRLREMMAGTSPTVPSAGVEVAADGPMTQRREQVAAIQHRNEIVVVVDDDPAIVAALRESLSEEGYTVRVGYHGVEGLHQALVEQPRPDLILLDLGLPFLPGDGVIAALNTTYDPPPVVLISASRPEDVPEILRSRFAFVGKPFRWEVVLRTVREAIAQGRVRRLPF